MWIIIKINVSDWKIILFSLQMSSGAALLTWINFNHNMGT